MATMTMSEAVHAYRVGNDAGAGYAPDGETINEAVAAMVADGGELLLERASSGDVALVRDSSGELVAIGGDAMGRHAWAVTVEAPASGRLRAG